MGVEFFFFFVGRERDLVFQLVLFFPKNAIPPHPPLGSREGQTGKYLHIFVVGGNGEMGVSDVLWDLLCFIFEMEGEGNGFVSHFNNI